MNAHHPAFRPLLADIVRHGGRRLGIGVMTGTLGAGLEGVGLLLLLPLLAAVGMGGAPAPAPLDRIGSALGLGGTLGLWVAVVAAHSLFTAWRDVDLVRLNQDFVRLLRVRLHAAVLEMDWAEFQRLRSSDIVAAQTGATVRVAQGLANLVQLAVRLMLIAVHGAIALALAPGAALLALAAAVALVVVQIPRMRRMVGHGVALSQGLREVHAAVAEHVAALKLAKSHNAESGFAAAFERDVLRLGEGTLGAVGEGARGRARQRVAAAILMAMVVWVAVAALDMSGPRLLVLVAVFARLLPAVADAVQAVFRVAEMLPAYQEIETLRHRCMESAQPKSPGLSLPAGAVTLRGIGYTWPDRHTRALADIDLVIAENRTTALIGPSGAGKTTLADLCLGLLVPDAGTITVGNVALSGAERAAWRETCAVVPQEVFLFNDTVRANLAWARPSAGDEDLWEALDAAAAADLVRRLPMGLETPVGDRGIRLSGGERQRLALARALVRRPSFLVLDEATSHLDRGHERLILDSLERLHGRLTVLLIAHRLATVRHADAIAVIEDGRVTEQGTWAGLATSGGWLTRVAADFPI